MCDQLVRDFTMLFVTVDPIGTLALFVPLTAGVDARRRRRIAVRAVVAGGLTLLGFLVAGELLFSALGVRLLSFQLAGGVILFLFGLQMVFGAGVAAESAEPEPPHDVAIFPLALPAIASPGSIMAVVLLTDNHRFSVPEQAITAAVVVVVLAITLVVLLASAPIHRAIGHTGASALVRVMGLILAALAAEQIVAAVELLVKGNAA